MGEVRGRGKARPLTNSTPWPRGLSLRIMRLFRSRLPIDFYRTLPAQFRQNTADGARSRAAAYAPYAYPYAYPYAPSLRLLPLSTLLLKTAVTLSSQDLARKKRGPPGFLRDSRASCANGSRFGASELRRFTMSGRGGRTRNPQGVLLGGQSA